MFGIEKLTEVVESLATRIVWLERQVKSSGDKVVASVDGLTAQITELNANLRLMIGPPSPTGKFEAIYLTQSEEDPSMFLFRLMLPQLNPDAPNKKDAVRGEAHLRFDDVTQPVINTEIGQASVEPIKIAVGVNVTGRFVFADEAGNLSANPIELTPFTVSDQTPPPDPEGSFGMIQIGQDDSEPEVGGGEVGGATPTE